MKKSAVIIRVLKYLLDYKGLLVIAAALTVLSNFLALVAPELSGRAIDAIVDVGNVNFNTVYLYADDILLRRVRTAELYSRHCDDKSQPKGRLQDEKAGIQPSFRPSRRVF